MNSYVKYGISMWSSHFEYESLSDCCSQVLKRVHSCLEVVDVITSLSRGASHWSSIWLHGSSHGDARIVTGGFATFGIVTGNCVQHGVLAAIVVSGRLLHLGLLLDLGLVLIYRRKVHSRHLVGHLGHLLYGLHGLALRHLVHLLRLVHRLLHRHHGLRLRRVSRVVSWASKTAGRTASGRATVASWRRKSSTSIEVHRCGCVALWHVLRDTIDSTEAWRNRDSLALTISIDGT